MASLADASMASMPTADIEALQAQLLNASSPRKNTDSQTNFRTGSLHARLTQASLQQDLPADLDVTGNIAANDSVSVWREGEVATTQDAEPTRSLKVASELLQKRHTRSAPASQTKAMEEKSALHSRLLATFHGLPGGDTQPMDTQVYKHFNNPVLDNALQTPYKPITLVENTTGGKSLDEDTYTNTGQHNAGEYDSYIDLHLSQGARSDVSDEISVLASPQSQLPKSIRRMVTFPETPQVAGHKRGVDGEVILSAARSEEAPNLEALFGPVKPALLTTTQMFENTQARSSPPPGGPRSDPVFTRPSPNIEDNTIFTSHAGYSSSPNLGRHNVPSSTAIEPRDRYTSMLESQDRHARLRSTALPNVLDDDLFDDSDGRRFEQRRLRRIQSHQALVGCKSVSAPARPATPLVGGQHTAGHARGIRANPTNQHANGSMSSPQKLRTETRSIETSKEPIVIPDDEEDCDSALHDNDEVNDDYDELMQAVVRSSARPRDRDSEDEAPGTASESETDIHNDDVEDESPNDHADVVPGSQYLQQAAKRVFHATQPITISQSQVVPQSERRSLLATNPQHSSTTSVIPGSQYALTTSQQLARHSQQWPRSQPADTVRSVPTKPTARVASSPPLLEAIDDVDGQENVDQNQDSPSLIQAGDVSQYDVAEVADSDLVSHTEFVVPGLHQRAGSASGQYATALSELSPTKSRRPSQSGQAVASQYSMATPLRHAGAKRAADIANMPTQYTSEHDMFKDINDIADVLYTEEDQEYARAMSPSPGSRTRKRGALPASRPAAKRRRLSERSAVNGETASSHNNQSRTGVQDQEQVAGVATAVDDERQQVDADATEEVIEARSSALQHDHNNDQSTAQTPKSVRHREAAGSAVVSQLIASRVLGSEHPAKLSGPGKRTYSRKSRMINAEAVDTPQQRAPGREDDLPLSTPGSARSDTKATAAAQHEQVSSGSTITRPDRCFALFKDANSKYYPATATGFPAGAGLMRVKFDDGSESVIKTTQQVPLDLRLGDVVRIDRPNMRNSWVVQGLDFTVGADDSLNQEVDIYGHHTILVRPKNARRSSTKFVADDQAEVVKVGIANIYLLNAMVMAYKGRDLDIREKPLQSTDGRSTPVGKRLSTNASTPRSRSGRQATRKQQQYVFPSSSAGAEEIMRAPRQPRSGGVFSSMAFAITSAPGVEVDRKELIEEIEFQGGIILERGFDELFETSDVLRKCTIGESNSSGGVSTLRVKPQFESLGFVALIADQHCRTAKYMQALALGLPTLSTRWVRDTLEKANPSAAGSANALSWSTYLLPAGESSYLDRAIRSRTLAPYLASRASFTETIGSRELLFDGDKVLVVMPQKGKSADRDKRISYAFLTLAIGAGNIRLVANLSEAKALVSADDSWRWILVENSVEVAASFFNAADDNMAETKVKSRGVDATAKQQQVLCRRSDAGGVSIISDEFVVQSLILGALME